MGDAIWAAIIAGVFSLTGTIITVWKMHQKTVAALEAKSDRTDANIKAELEKHQAVTDTKIDELTRRMEKHNQIVERTFILEGAVKELQHEVRDMKGGHIHEAE